MGFASRRRVCGVVGWWVPASATLLLEAGGVGLDVCGIEGLAGRLQLVAAGVVRLQHASPTHAVSRGVWLAGR